MPKDQRATDDELPAEPREDEDVAELSDDFFSTRPSMHEASERHAAATRQRLAERQHRVKTDDKV